MPQIIVWIFLLISGAFATVHRLAVETSLYWYYSWFDIIMHLWGGALIVLGVFALCSLKHVPLKPTTFIITTTLFILIVGWEVFERMAGLYEPSTYIYDVSKDIIVGITGGAIGYLFAIKFKL
jgi:hypothetical protein